MLTKKQIEEIREHLSRAQNPVFFFDDDPDGLCSFLILRRFIGRGKGVPIKSFPELDKSYLRRVNEFNSDYVFILDKPLVSSEFFEEARKINMPLVWIDHHLIEKNLIPDFVSYYNPLDNDPECYIPTTELVYQSTKRSEDMWLSVIGCISDMFLPNYYEDFQKNYPDLSIDSDDPHEIYYNSPVGRIVGMLGNGLKDRTTNVMKMINFLIEARGPYDILEENVKNATLHRRHKELSSKYDKLLQKAIEIEEEDSKIVFFKYGGDLSTSGSLANELSFRFPKKIIVVCYIKGGGANISMRGNNVRDIFQEAIKGIESANGGGHENAVGGQMSAKDLEKFKENLKSIVTKK